MICKECNNKMVRDHVKDEVDYFVCLNKNCKEYSKVISTDSEKSDMQIKDKFNTGL